MTAARRVLLAGLVPAVVLIALALPALGAVALRLAGLRAGWSRSTPVAAAELAPDTRAIWVSRVTNPRLVGLSVLVTAPCWWRVRANGPGVLVPAALLGLVLLAFSTVRVVVRPAGLTVGLGPWGFPARRIARDHIVRAGTDVIEPLAYGGWGWRVVPHRTAVVVRSGEALVVELRNGDSFAVTVDGAAEAAALLNAQTQPSPGPDAR